VNDDFALLDRWRAGDTSAGNQLFQRYFDSMYRFFANKLREDADELVQTTFLAIVRSHHQFRKKSSFRTYLYTVARHELYRYLRKSRQGDALDFGVTSIVDIHGTSPSRRIAIKQEKQRLLMALESLPVEQQILLELHYWEDMGNAELAQVFDIPETTARTRLFRARKALRTLMEQNADAPLPPDTSMSDFEAWARRVGDKQ